ncbi:MAG TPA: hypothetical protein PLJ71_02440 [Candidatus Hydrogenedentes bacterium]|nr:hypothetical protein [Candidatus Hydrogenedentota bacterium]HQM47513.1 hypothetical protein [Candidatus Hydrogenedentota bacterium]
MNELGSLIVIVIVIVASVIGKIQEQRKAQERKKSRTPVRPEDLPEATRRLLYGTPDKPAADARRESPQVRTAQPRTAPPVQRQQPVTVRRPVQPPVQRPVQQTATPPPPPPPSRRRVEPQPRVEPAPTPLSLQARHEQLMAQRLKQLEEARTQRAAMIQRAQQLRRQAPGAAAQEPRSRKRTTHPAMELFSNLDDVRRGIVMAQVLGSPKAFE